MPNLRIIYDNAADRATVLMVGGVGVAGMGAENLTNNTKSRVCRSADKSLGINTRLAVAELINSVVLAYTNVSPTTLMRVRATTDTNIATNYVTYSEQFEAVAWNKGGGTVTANSFLAPDGSTTGERFLSSAADAYLSQAVAVGTAGQTLVFSVWLKSTANRTVNIYSNGGATITPCAVTTTWKRFSSAVTLSSAGCTVQIGGGNSLPSGTEVHVWGAQLEFGGTPTTYFPTTSAAMQRPVGYIDNWQAYQYDTGYQPVVLAPPSRLRGWTAAAQASAYAYGGGTNLRHWMPTALAVTGIRIDLYDENNLQGYVEVSRLIIGQYWSPSDVGAAEGSTMTVGDTSKHFRTDAGDQYTDTGTRFRKQSVSLPSLNAADRAKFWEILWGNGMSYPIFISLYPANADPKLEQAYEIYGKLLSTPVMGTPYFNRNSATVEIEEV